MVTIDMIHCPACKKEWIEEVHEFVCPQCIPNVQADMAVWDLHKSVQDIDGLEHGLIISRLDIIKRARDHLNAIIKMAKQS